MIDVPPEPPALPSKPPAEGLIDCGLQDRGFTVTYDDDLQGYVIQISATAGANSENIQCIWDATWTEFVQFADLRLQQEYDQLSRARFEPLARQSALDHLAKRGLLEGLPKRSDFTSRADFGVALEGHCGLAPRSVLHEDGDVFLFMPDDSAWSSDTYEKHACLLSALVAAGETKFGFVGNEKIAEPEGK